MFSEDFEELAREVLKPERDTVIELRNKKRSMARLCAGSYAISFTGAPLA
jgi:hypothetical protein